MNKNIVIKRHKLINIAITFIWSCKNKYDVKHNLPFKLCPQNEIQFIPRVICRNIMWNVFYIVLIFTSSYYKFFLYVHFRNCLCNLEVLCETFVLWSVSASIMFISIRFVVLLLEIEMLFFKYSRDFSINFVYSIQGF